MLPLQKTSPSRIGWCCNLNDKKQLSGLSIAPPLLQAAGILHFLPILAGLLTGFHPCAGSRAGENVHGSNTLRLGDRRAKKIGVTEAHKLARSLQILVVEDSPSDIRLMREALRDTQLLVHLSVAHDGVEATELLEASKANLAPLPDLILLDLNLPRKNGREVLAEIKNDAVLKRIPVLVMTSSTDEEEISEVYNLKANCYIRKPSELHEYENVIRAIEDFWLLTVVLPDPHSSPLAAPPSWSRKAAAESSSPRS